MLRKLPGDYFKRGQTVLVVLLIIAVVLTIGLSAVSSSITDIKISQETEESSRAYYVAESALEEQLLLLADAPSFTSGNLGGIGYQVAKTVKGGEEFLFADKIETGDFFTVWLVGHNPDGSLKQTGYYNGNNLTVYWGESEKTAVSLSLLYKQGSVYKIKRVNCDSEAGRIGGNNFIQAGGSGEVAGTNLKFSCPISLEVGTVPYLLKIAVYYNSGPQAVGIKTDEGKPLPTQSYCFEAQATVPESGITRKIKQCKSWLDLPPLANWGLFSGDGDLQKSL